MNNFNKGGFNKGGFGGERRSFGGKPSFGGGRDFKKKSWDSAPRGGRDFGGDKQMHPAICSGCGKSCEVPFRPSAGKEVFCNDCFGKTKGDETFVRNDSRPSGGQNIDAVVRQLQVVASKLDQLIGIMNAQAKPTKAVVAQAPAQAEVVAAAVEKPAKAKAKKVAAPKKVAAKKKTA